MKNQPIVRLTQEFTFEMAHALHNYDGVCRNIHGHSYLLSITIKGKPSADAGDVKNGMVVDFGVMKKIVEENILVRYDHALVLNSSSYLGGKLKKELKEKIIWTAYQPTCENLMLEFARIIGGCLPRNLKLHSIRLREAPGSCTEWFADDNK